MKYQPSKCESLSRAVIWALSVEKDIPPEELRPLYDSIDPEALDNLFSGRVTDGKVMFEHRGYCILVHSSGEVRVEKVKHES